MTRRIDWHETARNEFRALGEYSEAHWGVARTRKYLDRMLDLIDRVAENPMLGRDAELPRPGLRKIKAGSHVVFYTVSDDRVEVVRILHESRDIKALLR
jgi:toxin ParE1/3/4